MLLGQIKCCHMRGLYSEQVMATVLLSQLWVRHSTALLFWLIMLVCVNIVCVNTRTKCEQEGISWISHILLRD